MRNTQDTRAEALPGESATMKVPPRNRWQVLLVEYELLDAYIAQLTSRVWSSGMVLIGLSMLGISFMATTMGPGEAITLNLISLVGGIGSLLAVAWWLLLRRMYASQRVAEYRRNEIERELSKDQILELFLNTAYLGARSYGVAAAAHAYYGKQLDELTLAECAMIASLPKAPSRITPINNPPRALARRNYVLGRLLDLGYITQSQHGLAAKAEDFAFPHEPTVEVDARYAAEMARARIVEMFGNNAYTGG